MCDNPHFANAGDKHVNFTQFLKVHNKGGWVACSRFKLFACILMV